MIFRLWLLFVVCHISAFSLAQIRGFGSGRMSIEQSESCISEIESAAIENLLSVRLDSLKRANPRLISNLNQKSDTRFAWPLSWRTGFPGKSYFSISNHFDLLANSGIRDFNCLRRTYNGHRGVDIFLWPAWWKKMDEEQVDVVASQKGVILARADGNFDRQCVWTNAQWNAVYVLHPDNQIVWYGHLKRNTVTSKLVGDSVAQGEYLGKVGSSGRSSGPHLHFEVTKNSTKFDPFQGPCQSQSSLWQNQLPYWNSFLSLSQTQSSAPIFPNCPAREDLLEKSHFEVGDSVFLCNYYRDLRNGDTTIVYLQNSIGEYLDTVFHIDTLDESFYSAAYNFWFYVFDVDLSPPGSYTFTSIYKRDTSKVVFQYGDSTITNITSHSIFTKCSNFYISGNMLKRKKINSPEQIELYAFDGRKIFITAFGVNEKEIKLPNIIPNKFVLRSTLSNESHILLFHH